MFNKIFKKKKNKGISLVELMVVISIFAILSSITIFNYGQFKSSLSIQNLVDDIALSVRRAQSYAVGVLGSKYQFSLGYGIHFTINPETNGEFSGNNKSFVLFTDVDKSKSYNYDRDPSCGSPTESNECLELLKITTADNLSMIKYTIEGSENKIKEKQSLDIWFKRPNLEPSFCITNEGESKCLDESSKISSIEIIVSNDADSSVSKSITISNNGQINTSL